MTDRHSDLARIREALAAASHVFDRFPPGAIASSTKSNRDPVTEADLGWILLRDHLVRPGEGWLSEETIDDDDRLKCERVWVVDPLDGTKEFVAGIPEWCVSIGLVENGQAVAGGILSPWIDFLALGAEGLGCTLNGLPARPSSVSALEETTVLASRTEVGRGQWKIWEQAPFRIEAMGSVAYKLARVAVGLADATWTFIPKHEWDVAGGVALILAAGGWAATTGGAPLVFNRPNPRLAGLIASGQRLEPLLRATALRR